MSCIRVSNEQINNTFSDTAHPLKKYDHDQLCHCVSCIWQHFCRMLNKLLHKSQYSEKLRIKILSLYSLSLQKCYHTSTSVIIDCPCEAQRIRDFIYRVIKRIGPNLTNVYCTSIFHYIIIDKVQTHLHKVHFVIQNYIPPATSFWSLSRMDQNELNT